MAKKRNSTPKEATKNQQLRWQAEQIVREAVTSSPGFKKAVNQAMKDLKMTQKRVIRQLKKK